MTRPDPPLTQHRLTSLQLTTLTVVFLYSSTLLSSIAYQAEEAILLAPLIGCLLGCLWMALLGKNRALGQNRHRLLRLPILLGLLILLLTNLSDFGLFWSVSFSPALSPALVAAMLFLLALPAVYHGATCIGRFAQIASLSLIPLLLILLSGIGQTDFGRLLPADLALLPSLKSGLGILVSQFGDGVAIGLLAFDLSDSDTKTVFRPSSQSSPSPLRALLIGAIGASLLILGTVAAIRTRLPLSKLQSTPYPLPLASALLHEQVLDPLFLLCLTLLYTVKLQVLLLACCRLLGALLPSSSAVSPTTRALIPLTAAVFAFLPFLALRPDIPLSARSSPLIYALLLFSEFFTPFFLQIISFFKKGFDKSPLL